MSQTSRLGLRAVALLALVVPLSALAVAGDLTRWQPLNRDSLRERFVGNTNNKLCCHRAWKLECDRCLDPRPACNASPVYGSCQNGYGESKAECVDAAKGYCVSSQINQTGKVKVEKCEIMTGSWVLCADNKSSKCSVTNRTADGHEVDYTDCNSSSVSLCTTQPSPACIYPPP